MADSFNVFISWSGKRSKWMADALRDWLPMVIQSSRPWMSETDIEKGSRGLNEISGQLAGTKVGISCLTPENLLAPWLHYEAGALSKTIDDKTRLCTYLLGGLEIKDVGPPLGMFQATKPTRDDTKRMVSTINRAVTDSPLGESTLDRLFAKMWPDLDEKLQAMPKSDEAPTPQRSVEEMLAEAIEFIRMEPHRSEYISGQLAAIVKILNRAPYADPFVWFSNSNLAGGQFASLRDLLGDTEQGKSAKKDDKKGPKDESK
jgi:hypothetical protein